MYKHARTFRDHADEHTNNSIRKGICSYRSANSNMTSFFRLLCGDDFIFTKPQKRRWRSNKVIPLKVLLNIWNKGILFMDSPPEHGLKLNMFLDKLNQFIENNANSDSLQLAQFLYDKIHNESMNGTCPSG